MTYSHLFCAMSLSPPILRHSYFKIWPWKSLVNTKRMVRDLGHIWPWTFKEQGHCQGQAHWSHLRHGIHSICLLFVSWIFDFLVEQIPYLTLKIQGQAHGQGQTWWSHLRPKVQSICLCSFHGNRTILAWDIANYIFDLEKWKSRSRPRSKLMITYNDYIQWLLNQHCRDWSPGALGPGHQ